jgi:hypothetical protein
MMGKDMARGGGEGTLKGDRLRAGGDLSTKELEGLAMEFRGPLLGLSFPGFTGQFSSCLGLILNCLAEVLGPLEQGSPVPCGRKAGKSDVEGL